MFYTKVTELIFNTGETLAINPNDIVIFVGPNNCGKSQSLRDIYSKISTLLDSVVISDIRISKGDRDEFIESVKHSSKATMSQNPLYSGYKYQIYNSNFGSYLVGDKLHESFRPYLVDMIKTEDRLTMSNPPDTIDSDTVKSHPIHYLVDNKEYSNTISKYFKEAFGINLNVDYNSKKKTPLLLGPIPHLSAGAAPDVINNLGRLYQSYPKLHEQGDGMRSFAGILLHLILKNYGIFLIDEPESFLHPPQALILGKVIGELLGEDRQAFISTHSEDVIKGLMEKCSDRIKIVRITRNENHNSFAILDHQEFNAIWGDPLLKNSNVMSSLFHKNVVLCESDSDCRLYSVVLDHLKQKEGKYTETMFTYTSGKQRMKKVANALKSLGIDFRCIPDIDVLNDKQILKELYESCGGTWDEEMESNYKTFSSQFNGGKTTITKDEVKAKVDAFLASHDCNELSKKDIESLRSDITPNTKWHDLKLAGISIIPAGQATKAFDTLNERLVSTHIHLVKVGELERFVPQVGGHGPSWVNTVLETYNNLDDEVYKNICDFVRSWNI